MGSAFDMGFGLGANRAQNAGAQAEAERLAQRDKQAELVQSSIQALPPLPKNPDDPEYAAQLNTRKQLMGQLTSLYQPHEAPSLLQRVSGLIHGHGATDIAPPPQPVAGTAAPPQFATQPFEPVPVTPVAGNAGTPPPPPTPSANVAPSPSDPPMHPFRSAHPLLARFQQSMGALDNHLKGFAHPMMPAPSAVSDEVVRNYRSPVELSQATEDQKEAGKAKVAAAKPAPRGSIQQQRYDAIARSMKKPDGSNYSGFNDPELSREDSERIARDVAGDTKTPVIHQNPKDGLFYSFTYDPDTQEERPEVVKTSDGQPIGGFKPDKVTVRNGVYHFVGADNQVHETPVTTTTTQIFGPHAKEGPPPEPELHQRPPAGDASPATVNRQAVADKLNRKRSGSRQVPAVAAAPSSPSPTAPAIAGRSLGGARMSTADRSIMETDQQLVPTLKTTLSALEPLKNMNSLTDRAQMQFAFEQYKHGFAPAEPYGSIIRNVAAIGIQGAAPWQRLGRSKYQFEVIQQHLPQPSDSPKLMYDKIKWLNDSIIPESIKATQNQGAPQGSPAAPKTVKMRAPNGQEKDVDPSQVEFYKGKGAKVVQ